MDFYGNVRWTEFSQSSPRRGCGLGTRWISIITQNFFFSRGESAAQRCAVCIARCDWDSDVALECSGKQEITVKGNEAAGGSVEFGLAKFFVGFFFTLLLNIFKSCSSFPSIIKKKKRPTCGSRSFLIKS